MSPDAAVALQVNGNEEPEARPQREKTVMVSARIPASLCNRVKDILREMGSSQTELVNAAFEYVREKGELPDSRIVSGQHQRHVTEEEIENFRVHMREITGSRVAKPEYAELDDDEVLSLALTEKYLGISGDAG